MTKATMVQRAMAAVERAVRGDSWRNTLTNTGTNYGKNATSFTPALGDYLADETLARLYELDGLAARIVDAVPKHAMRHAPTIVAGDAAQSAAVKAALDDLGAWARLQEAWTWARLLGGGGVFVGADDGRDPSLPLDPQAITRVRFLVSADQRDLQPAEWHRNGMSSTYGTPSVYRLLQQGGAGSTMSHVHASRVIRFDGVMTTKTRRMERQGWGDSVLQRVHTELSATRGAFGGAGTLIHEASVVTVGVKGLMDLMASDPTDTLKTRFDVMQRMMGLGRWMIHDADGETVERLEVGALTGVVDVLDRFVNFLAAVTGTPVTVLMGQAPAGLNATGDSDIRSWYDEVAAERERVLRPALETLIRWVLLSREGPTRGVEPEGWRVDFAPLWQPTPAEKADLRAKQAATDSAYVTAGVLTPEEVAVNRFRPDGWSDETVVDLDARRAAMERDLAGEPDMPEGETGAQAQGDGEGVDHEAVAAILARVAGREIPRGSGVAMLAALGMDGDAADALMGETGRTFFTAPESTHAAEMEALRAELSAAQRSLRGHKAYTARVVQRAREGGLELGAFTPREPTEVDEGEALEAGDVVAVPVVEDAAGAPREDAVPERYAHIGFVPPKGAREAAARALEVRAEKPESQRGMTDVGIARARDLSNGSRLSPDTVRRMLNFFTRHEGDKAGETWDEQGPGWQAWQGWGGDAGYAWARKVVAQMEAADQSEGA